MNLCFLPALHAMTTLSVVDCDLANDRPEQGEEADASMASKQSFRERSDRSDSQHHARTGRARNMAYKNLPHATSNPWRARLVLLVHGYAIWTVEDGMDYSTPLQVLVSLWKAQGHYCLTEQSPWSSRSKDLLYAALR